MASTTLAPCSCLISGDTPSRLDTDVTGTAQHDEIVAPALPEIDLEADPDDTPDDARSGAAKSLSGVYDFCSSVTCRHRSIGEYFGQSGRYQNATVPLFGT